MCIIKGGFVSKNEIRNCLIFASRLETGGNSNVGEWISHMSFSCASR